MVNTKQLFKRKKLQRYGCTTGLYCTQGCNLFRASKTHGCIILESYYTKEFLFLRYETNNKWHLDLTGPKPETIKNKNSFDDEYIKHPKNIFSKCIS